MTARAEVFAQQDDFVKQWLIAGVSVSFDINLTGELSQSVPNAFGYKGTPCPDLRGWDGSLVWFRFPIREGLSGSGAERAYVPAGLVLELSLDVPPPPPDDTVSLPREFVRWLDSDGKPVPMPERFSEPRRRDWAFRDLGRYITGDGGPTAEDMRAAPTVGGVQ